MLPWTMLDSTTLPGETRPLMLLQHGSEFVIRIGPLTLMSNRAHDSEDALAELACSRIAGRPDANVLVGGLGMGFTLAAALRQLGPTAKVEVAELIPAVVLWNRGRLAPLAGRPLADRRVSVWEGDVADRVRGRRAELDAILLDVDNGPNGLTVAGNDWLYSAEGLRELFGALREGGVLGVWSVDRDRAFTSRLGRAGFEVEEEYVRALRSKGGKHTVWLATRPGGSALLPRRENPVPPARRPLSGRAWRLPGTRSRP